MRLKDIIKGEKEILDPGSWKRGDNRYKVAFPITKGKLKLGSAFSWKIIRFKCLENNYKLLIFFREDKEVYSAYLAVEASQEIAILAKYEYHATHPGWHMHVVGRCETSNAEIGRIGGLPERIPSKRKDFGIETEDEAQSKAVEAFGLSRIKGGLF